MTKLIEYNSQEYDRACELRYQMFYAQHNLPWNIVFNQDEAHYFHIAIAVRENIVAYGQLASTCDRNYQIKQMVVEHKYQKRGLGKQILLALINIATQKSATRITLNSRLSAIGFYQKLGFQTYGDKFPSSTTRVMHIPMKLEL